MASELSRSWQGLGPLAWCSETSALAGALGSQTEAGNKYVSGLSAARTFESQNRQRDAEVAKGHFRIDRREMCWLNLRQVGGVLGGVNSPKRDWGTIRLGADPPSVLQSLRMDVNRMRILGACGIPLELVEGSGSGQASRESFRRFVNLSIKPLSSRWSNTKCP